MRPPAQAGSAAEWGAGVPVPEGILQRARSMLQELSSIACEGKEGVSVAEFLAGTRDSGWCVVCL